MLIDWFTVIAQIVNFLVLVWLLKHFLYARILRAVDRREAHIATREAEADAKAKQASGQLALYQAGVRDFEQQREAMVAQAKREAEKQHAEMLEDARERVRSLETRWQEELDRERHAFLLDLRRRAATEIVAIARRAVADLACRDVQMCAIQVFLEKVRSLESAEWDRFAQGELSIRSAIELPEDTRRQIQLAIEQRLDGAVRLRFERAPEIGLGLELCGNGWRIGWNSESYLEALEEDVSRALERGAADTEMAKAAR
jgi:F-type H+-transporting ATPase subunit b